MIGRLHGLVIGENFSDFPSKPTFKFNDPNFLQSSSSAETLELLRNVLEDKYLNGISIEFGENVNSSNDLKTSVFDNVLLATHFAIEFQGLKR